MRRISHQVHGHVSCVFVGALGPVGAVPQAASDPSSEAARTSRMISWRDTRVLLKRKELRRCAARGQPSVTGRYRLSLQVT